MKRLLFLALLCLAVPGLLAHDGPQVTKPQDAKIPNMFPLIKGSTWDFDVNVNGMTIAIHQEMTDVTKKGDQTTATLSSDVNGQKLEEVISVDAKGIYRHSISTFKLEKPLHTFKFPVEPQKWTESIKLEGMDIEVKLEMKAAEDVSVPAGNYKKVTPVNIVMNIQGQEVVATNYYAEGVGIIKQEMSLAGTKVTSELKKYTPGK